jgi:hypothetical protein
MDNLFLAREVGSVETGPQTFAGTTVPDTSIIFAKKIIIPSLFSSVLVEGAGVLDVNGVYNYITDFEEKPYYTKGETGDYFIVYFENQWNIYDFQITSFPIYYAEEDVPFPWLVSEWFAFENNFEPVPVVTEIF